MAKGKRKISISTPRGTLFQTKSSSGSITAKLEWSTGFGPKYSKGFESAQEFVDSECLRYCDPLVPRRTGYLIKSGQLGTVIGSGELVYLAPYARRQYYENAGKSGGNRGKLWFERMKASKKETIRKGAVRYVSSQ